MSKNGQIINKALHPRLGLIFLAKNDVQQIIFSALDWATKETVFCQLISAMRQSIMLKIETKSFKK